jgi:hypothetical protein
MLPAVPFGSIANFRQEERRCDRIEDFIEIKHARTIRPARGDVGEIFIGAAFGDDTSHHVRRPPASGGDFDKGKFFVERCQDFRVGDLLAAVKRQLTFLLRCPN